jgi:tetratricopeptide (TPR) repeat protein
MRGIWVLPILAACCSPDEPPAPAPPKVAQDSPLPAPPPLLESLPALIPQEEKLSVDQALAAANDLIEKRETDGSLEHAAALLRYHWQRHPDSGPLNTLLAQLHVRFLDRLDSDNAEDRPKMAKHREAGKLHAKEALRIDAQNGPAHYWFGHILLQFADAEQSYGRLKEAVPQFEAAEKADPNYDNGGPLRMLGRIYQETPGGPFFMGDKKKAMGYFERAVAASGEFLQNRLWLAEVYVDQKKFAEAKSQIDSILNAKPRQAHAREDQKYQEKAKKLQDKIPSQK